MRKYKGVICTGENITFPLTVTYLNEVVPVVLSFSEPGDYLLARLGTDGEAIEIAPITVGGPGLSSQLSAPFIRQTIVKLTTATDFVTTLPLYVNAKTMALIGLTRTTGNGDEYLEVYHKHSPFCKFLPDILSINKRTLVAKGRDLNAKLALDAKVVVVVNDREVTCAIDDPSISSLTFECPVDFSFTLTDDPMVVENEVAVLDLTTREYVKSGVVVEYDGINYTTTDNPTLDGAVVLVSAGEPQNPSADFAMQKHQSGWLVIPALRIKPHAIKV